MIEHYYLDGHIAKLWPSTGDTTKDLLAWAHWFETCDRHVRLTRVGPYYISTIFLGLDHSFRFLDAQGPPILFETMAWIDTPGRTIELGGKTIKADREFIDMQARCATWDEAQLQHHRAIYELKQPEDQIEELTVDGKRKVLFCIP